MYTARRILVPMDFSDISRRALSAALQLAGANDAELYLFHVEQGMERDLRRRLDEAPNESVIEDTILQTEQALRDAAERELQRCAEAGRELALPPLQVRVTGGEWLEVALQLVDEWEIDLVVTGTRGRQGVRGLLRGSVSEQLVARCPCSVFVVKATGFPYLRE